MTRRTARFPQGGIPVATAPTVPADRPRSLALMAPQQPLPRRISDNAQEAAEHVLERVREVKEEVKPKLRGWLHAGTSPLALAAGIVLVALSPDLTTRVGSAIFATTALMLFTVSAIYHRGTWSPRTWALLRRFDHSNIFLLIAGSYTPFTLILLHGAERVGAAGDRVDRRRRRAAVPRLLERRAALGLRADLRRPRLGGDLLRPRLLHRRRRR